MSVARARTRPGAQGALLLEACLRSRSPVVAGPTTSRSDDVPVRIHGMDADPFFAGEGDMDAARALVATAADAGLFLHPGARHLFTDGGLPSYDAHAATLVTERALDFPGRVAQPGTAARTTKAGGRPLRRPGTPGRGYTTRMPTMQVSSSVSDLL
jgi:hypothetical protein